MCYFGRVLVAFIVVAVICESKRNDALDFKLAQLSKVFEAIDGALDYLIENDDKMNLDGALGVRMIQGELC